MARNGSGGYSLPEAAFIFDTVIEETKVNNNFSDLGSEIANSIAKDGQTTVTANLPMNSKKHTGVAAGTALAEYADVKSVQNSSYIWCGTAGGTANALTLTPSPAITALVAGQVFRFEAGSSASTSTVTIAVSGLSAVAGQIDGAALSSTVVIEADKFYEALYDGTALQLTRLSFDLATGLVTTAGTQTITGAKTFDNATGQTIKSSDAGATGARLTLFHDSDSPANGDASEVVFDADDAAGTRITYARVRGVILGTPTAGAASGRISFRTRLSGSEGDRVFVSAGLHSNGETDQGARTANFQTLYESDVSLANKYSQGPTTAAAQATTSGTVKTFGSIPAGTTRITVLLHQVSVSGTDDILIQLGDAGGLETSGYVSVCSSAGAGGNTIDSSTAGFIIGNPAGAGMVTTATYVFHHMGSNIWIGSLSGGEIVPRALSGGGDKTLSAELTQLAILMTGSDTFDAGSVNIIYE